MATQTRKTITRAEFDKRLDESNERRCKELQQTEEDQARVEQLLTHYENTLDEIESELRSNDEPPSYPILLRKRLEELARKTAEVATSL
jgi:DNA-binding MarR family transcriptional regulator